MLDLHGELRRRRLSWEWLRRHGGTEMSLRDAGGRESQGNLNALDVRPCHYLQACFLPMKNLVARSTGALRKSSQWRIIRYQRRSHKPLRTMSNWHQKSWITFHFGISVCIWLQFGAAAYQTFFMLERRLQKSAS
jgi:hypothetical protein